MELKNFVDLNEVEKILVFGWRNHLKIAPLMKNKPLFTESQRDLFY